MLLTTNECSVLHELSKIVKHSANNKSIPAGHWSQYHLGPADLQEQIRRVLGTASKPIYGFRDRLRPKQHHELRLVHQWYESQTSRRYQRSKIDSGAACSRFSKMTIFDLHFYILHRIGGQLLLPGPRGISDLRQPDRLRALADPVRVPVLGQGVEHRRPGLQRPLHLHP